MFKRLVSIFLCLLMAISLTACVSGGTGGGTAAGTGSGSMGGTVDPDPTPQPDPNFDWTNYSDIEKKAPFYDTLVTENYANNVEEIEVQPTFDSTAKWVWLSGNTDKNVWVRFRKSFELSSTPSSVKLKISAESRYFLYVNGNLAVYDGSLKRGNISSKSGYYDVVDVAKYLVKGENSICALVWYWGVKEQSYSNVSSGAPAFILQGKVGTQNISTDSTWKISKDVAYGSGLSGESQPNYRLPEYNISYDATKSVDEDWCKPDFDDTAWRNAAVVGDYGALPWGNLWKRPIPLNKDYGITEYQDSAQHIGKTTQRRTTYVVNVGTNVQLSPVFTIVSENEGERITVTTESTVDPQGDSLRCYYYTKKGEQTFECLSWMNGQFVKYDLPEKVTIKFLGYRQTGYDTEKVGSFSSNVDFYNRIWQMSYDTLYVTMRDNFMDCPNRERAQWMGDVTNEMEQIIYSMDENSYLLYEKALKQMVGFTIAGALPTVAPIQNSWFELPVQNLCTIAGAWTYYLYTGRSAIIQSSIMSFYRYLLLWEMTSDNILVHRPGSWDWMDNDDGGLSYTAGIENAWYYKALDALKNMALLCNNNDVRIFASARMAKLKVGFEKKILPELFTKYDERAMSIAVLAGLVPEEQYDQATQLFETVSMCSPFWEKYVLEALCVMGEYDVMMNRMRERYLSMYNYKEYGESYSTLWEKWTTNNGTRNHAWSGGPMTVLSKYVLGVQPLTSKYGYVLIKPNLSTLSEANGTVPTTKGNIDVSLTNKDGVFKMEVSSFKDTKAVLAIPFTQYQTLNINGDVLCKDGRMLKSSDYTFAGIDDECIYFLVDGGDYTITVA